MERLEGERLERLDREQLKQLLTRGWMTHDAMWFRHCLAELGIERTNRLNRAAIRSIAPIEVKRLQQVLGIAEVRDLEQLRAFLDGGMSLLIGDFMQVGWEWQPPDAVRVTLERCFAYEGIQRLGAIAEYECGIFERIYGWLDALGVRFEVEPDTTSCLMHHAGACSRRLQLTFGRD